jgi:flavin-dependent dehydrogenase
MIDLPMTPPLDVIILGGGPAGSAAAIELAHAGRRVALIERSTTAHHKVCGDFLSTEALASLNNLGLDLSALGAVPIHNVRLAGSLGISSATLPFAAQSLTRRALDEALLERAAAAHALVLRGHFAESLHRNGDLWRVSIAGPNHGYTLTAPHIFLATGKHDLRGLPRPLLGTHGDLVGLKMYLRLAPDQLDELRDTIELFLIPGGYGGLSLVEKPSDALAETTTANLENSVISTEAQRSAETPVFRNSRAHPQPVISETTTANLCFVIHRKLLRDAGRGWDALAALLTQTPHLRARLADAEPLLPRPLAISPLPYGLLRRHAIAENLWAIGDQAAVIPSFTGDGLALALHSGRFAARTVLDRQSAHHFHAELHKQLRHQLTFATLLSRGLVSQPRRAVIELAACLFPSTLRAVASHTRLPSQYLVSRLPKSSCAPA